MSDATTTRDRVWAAALDLAIERYSFTTSELLREADLDESKRKTARRTLTAMSELGYLSHLANSQNWSVGPKIASIPDRSHVNAF